MTVTGMATANDYSVSTSLEGTKNKHRIYSTGARNSDNLYVSRISKTVITSQVSTCVRAPVAAERNY
jgi:hypothetical protein